MMRVRIPAAAAALTLLCLTSLFPDATEATATAQATANALAISGREQSWSRYALSAHQSNGQRTCGAGTQLTAWTIQTEQWWARQTNAPTPSAALVFNTLGGFFQTSPGLFTTPISGIYYASIWARCETNNCDVTLRLNTATQLCAFGTDLIARRGDTSSFGGTWITSGCATIEYLTAGQTLSMWMESGGTNDCLLETNFVYNHINVMLLFADSVIASFATGPSG